MATWKKIITSGSNADLNQIPASAVKFPNDSIPIASLAEDAITIAGTSTALGGSITADTIAGQISADTISGNQINGGTIGSVTISALAGALSLGDNNITNVGDINADSISVDAAGTGLNIDFSGGNTTKNLITLQDDLADALNITEGSNSYIKFTTTDSSEKILFSKDSEFLGNVSGSATSTGSFGRLEGDGSGLTGIIRDIDDLDALGGTGLHQTQDHFVFSDNGTEKKITFSNLEDAIFGNVSGDATIAAGGALTIADDGVETDMIGDEQVTLAKLAHAAANTVLVRDANSAGDPSFKAVTNTQILIGDGTGFTAAALSGDVTMTNAGVTSVADNKIGNSELKQDDDITLQSLTTTNNVVVGGDLTVNGTTTTIATTNTKVEDQFMFLGTGSAGTNKDIGIIAQSGSTDLSGSALYHDTNSERWSVEKNVGHNVTAITPLQFVTTVKTDTVNPSSESGSYGAGEMHVNTDSGEIWIRFG